MQCRLVEFECVQAIVDDYVLSETVLRESRMHDELRLDVYLTSDDVIAATRDTMEQTIAYINEKYDSAAGYMHEVGGKLWSLASSISLSAAFG